jgi:voltage-gated potassium channel
VLLATKAFQVDQDRDARTLLAALTIEKLRPGIFTCAELLRRENIEHLSMAKVEEIVIGDEYMGHLIAHSSRARGIIKVMDELLTASAGISFIKSPCIVSVGKTFLDAFVKIKTDQDAILMAVEASRENQTVRFHQSSRGFQTGSR